MVDSAKRLTAKIHFSFLLFFHSYRSPSLYSRQTIHPASNKVCLKRQIYRNVLRIRRVRHVQNEAFLQRNAVNRHEPWCVGLQRLAPCSWPELEITPILSAKYVDDGRASGGRSNLKPNGTRCGIPGVHLGWPHRDHDGPESGSCLPRMCWFPAREPPPWAPPTLAPHQTLA